MPEKPTESARAETGRATRTAVLGEAHVARSDAKRSASKVAEQTLVDMGIDMDRESGTAGAKQESRT